MTVLLALSAAFCYGLSDFVGGVASRRTSVWPVGLLACTGALIGSTAIALTSTARPGADDVLWALVAGLGSGSGTAFLYRGLAAGRMGVVAPVSAVGAVLVPLAAGVGGGERPSALGWVGIVLAVPGIWLVAREDASSGVTRAAGLLDGVLAGIGFGLLFAALGQVSADAGYWPLVGTQGIAVLTMVAAALLLGGDPVPRRRVDLLGLAAGLLASLAVLFFLLASNHGLLSIASVIASLYPAFTVLFAITVLHEQVRRAQVLGLVLCAATIVCISIG